MAKRLRCPGAGWPCRRRWLPGLWVWVVAVCMVRDVEAATRGRTRTQPGAVPADRGSVTNAVGPVPAFAPVDSSDPLSALWNDIEFQRRLYGSYGFHGTWEPALREEEKQVWRERVAPALREDPARAVEVLRSLAGPESSAVFDFALGTALFQCGDLTNARPWLESAVAKHPDYLRAWKNLGFVSLRLGDYAGAIRALSRAMELGGADGATLGMLGFAHLQAGRPVAAAAATEQALVFRPDDLALQMQLLQAWSASGRLEPALKLVDEILAAHPDRAALWTWKAKLHLMRDERAEAAVAYETVRRLGAARAEDLFTLADLYVLLGTPETALPVYQEALEKDPAAGWARVVRAVEVMVGQGRTDMAARYMETMARSGDGTVPGEQAGAWGRLKARLAMARGDVDGALQVLERLLERDPLDGVALMLAGDCYAQKGDRDRAEFRYQAAAQIESVAPEALVKLAQLLVRHQEYRRAVELLQQAQRLRPRETVQRYLEEVLKLAGQRPVAS